MTLPRRSTLSAIVLFGALALLGRALLARPRILVLHSFREDSVWVRGVDAGIEAALAANRRPVSVTWHYMGLDRRVGAEERRVAAADARREIALGAPDVLIAVDDESNELVARDLVGSESPRVVYVSIDRAPASYGYGAPANVSGVAERLPLDGVREAITAMRTGAPARIEAIAADGESGRAEIAQVRAFDWSPHRLERSDVVPDFAKWQARVEDGAGLREVLLVLSTAGLRRWLPSSDDAGRVEDVPSAEVVAWTEAHSTTPAIGTQANWVEHGGALAISPPAAPVGRRAMELALDWLDDRDGDGPPPPVESAHFDVALDEGRLQARGLVMPRVWVEAARVGDAARP